MKRALTFVDKPGSLAIALGLDDDRLVKLDTKVNRMIEAGASIRKIIETVNAEDDLTDAEWTCFAYTLGYYDAKVRG